MTAINCPHSKPSYCADCWMGAQKRIQELEADRRYLADAETKQIEEYANYRIAESEKRFQEKEKEWIADRDIWIERYKKLRIDSEKELIAKDAEIQRLSSMIEKTIAPWKSKDGDMAQTAYFRVSDLEGEFKALKASPVRSEFVGEGDKRD